MRPPLAPADRFFTIGISPQRKWSGEVSANEYSGTPHGKWRACSGLNWCTRLIGMLSKMRLTARWQPGSHLIWSTGHALGAGAICTLEIVAAFISTKGAEYYGCWVS